ncbi:hypothetical protein RYX36_008775 [Vicia faba]
MAILYALVARGTVVLAEFSAVTGNTGAVARRLLEKLPTESDSRLCFSQDRYIFHILRSDGLALQTVIPEILLIKKGRTCWFPISFDFALNMKVLQFSAVIKLVAAPKALQIDEDGEKIR